MRVTKAVVIITEVKYILDIPSYNYTFEFMIESGVEDVLIISTNKSVVINCLNKYEGQVNIFDDISEFSTTIDGAGPLWVINGDGLVLSDKLFLDELLTLYESEFSNIVAVQNVGIDEIFNYDVVEIECFCYRTYIVRDLYNTKDINRVSSNIILAGHCITDFDSLNLIKELSNNSLNFMGFIKKLMKKDLVCAYNINRKYYDLKVKLDHFKITTELILKDEEQKENSLLYLENVLKEKELLI